MFTIDIVILIFLVKCILLCSVIHKACLNQAFFLFKEYAVLLEENENLQRQFQVCFFEMSIICSCHGDVSSFLSNYVNS